jgi:uncharacterized protein YecE (DUF72 family)
VNNPLKITSDYVYVRLIGDRSIPDSEFGKVSIDKSELIQKWADKIKKLENKVALAMVMSNNHLEGFGPATANTLRMNLGLEELVWDEKKQKKLEF